MYFLNCVANKDMFKLNVKYPDLLSDWFVYYGALNLNWIELELKENELNWNWIKRLWIRFELELNFIEKSWIQLELEFN